MSRRSSHRPPRYLSRLLDGYRAGLVPAGRVTIAEIYHDEWCALIRRLGPCNCDPDVEFRYVDSPARSA